MLDLLEGEPRNFAREALVGLSARRQLTAAESCSLEQECCWRGRLVAVRRGLVGAVHWHVDVDGLLLCEPGELGAQLWQVQRRHLPWQECIAEAQCRQ